MAASVVGICNRALQKLGASRITSLTDDSVNARACLGSYDSLKESELRLNDWNFAITRASLAADVDTPIFGRGYSYTLPSDFLKLLAPYPEQNLEDLDWSVEGKRIFTNDTAPLNVRYIYNVDDPAEMDPLFREALASRMAVELCEQITQSNTKKDTLLREYKENVKDARRRNAIEKRPADAPNSAWLTARR